MESELFQLGKNSEVLMRPRIDEKDESVEEKPEDAISLSEPSAAFSVPSFERVMPIPTPLLRPDRSVVYIQC